MSAILTYINKLIALLLSPLAILPAWLGLFIASALAGIGLLYLYGKVSNQTKIKNIKRQIYTYLLESIIFRKQLKQCLAAQLKMFFAGGKYFSLAIFPMMILAIPCVLLLGELNLRYGYKSFQAKESAIVEMQVSNPEELYKVKLTAQDGVQVTPPVRIPETSQIFWRIDVKKDGNKDLVFTLDGQGKTYSQTLHVGQVQQKITAVWDSSWLGKLLYPSAPVTIPNVKSLSISYPEQSYSLGFADTHWIIFFLIFSMLAGIVISRYIGVEI